MADYNITAVTRRVVYTGSAGVGPYAFTFPVISQTDIAVYKNSTKLTLTTNYTVTISSANGTGSVTLVVAATGSDRITIIGARAIERTTDFVTAGDLKASSLNEQLDASIILIQQLAEENKRTLKAPQFDPAALEDGGTVNMVLPVATSRAGKILAFDTDGNPVVGEDIGNWRGNWAAGVSFTVRDLVKDGSNSNVYRVNTAHTSSGTTPISSNADVAKFDLVIDAAAAAASAAAAAASASAASSSASAASTSASNASTSATNASTSASNSSTSASAAAASAAAAAASFDAFDDIYLGAYATNPTLDNDGNALTTGDQYFNTTANELRVWNGSSWQAASVIGGTITTLNVTGVASFADGSAALPSITNDGDTNTGIFFPAADTIAFTEGGVEAMRIASDGNVTFTNTAVMSSSFLRNRIINGDMRIDQRNAGAEVNPAVSGIYYVDRWLANSSAASKFKIGQNAGSVTPPVGYKNYLGLTSLSAYSVGAGEYFGTTQIIEGFNVADLGWGAAGAATVTLSFWVRSSLTGTFGGSLANSGYSRSYPFTYTISAANTWEQKTVTVAGDTSGTWLTTNGAGLILTLSIGSGSTLSGAAGAWASAAYTSATGATSVVGTSGATFYVTGVQLEVGTVATPFERQIYNAQLAQCQRYYEKSYEQSVVPGTASSVGYSSMNNPDQGTGVYIFNTDRFAVQKRAAATMRFWDLAGNLSRITDYSLGGLVRTDNRNTVTSYTGAQSCAVMINVQSASTAGTYQWDATAEL